MIKAAAQALAKAAADRGRGPAVSKDLDFLPYDRRQRLMQDAEDAVKAALAMAPWAERSIVPDQGNLYIAP